MMLNADSFISEFSQKYADLPGFNERIEPFLNVNLSYCPVPILEDTLRPDPNIVRKFHANRNAPNLVDLISYQYDASFNTWVRNPEHRQKLLTDYTPSADIAMPLIEFGSVDSTITAFNSGEQQMKNLIGIGTGAQYKFGTFNYNGPSQDAVRRNDLEKSFM